MPPEHNMPKPNNDPEYAILRAEAGTRALQILVHEFSNLVDGSLRSLSSAVRQLSAKDHGPELEEPLRNLRTASCGLSQMADLLHALARPGAGERPGRPLYSMDRPQPVNDSIEHAIRLLLPRAEDLSISIASHVSDALRDVPPSPVYGVVLNAIQNAIEAVGRGGSIEVHANVLPPSDTRQEQVVIEVIDDGPGPPSNDSARVFEFGFSTKSDGLGLGLALARDTIRGLGGTVTLGPAQPENRDRPGARLTIVYPVPPRADQFIPASAEPGA